MTKLNPEAGFSSYGRQKKRNRRHNGFTLIELLVTVGIVGTLTATALPAFVKAQKKSEAGALIGTIAGFAKECATNALTTDTSSLSGLPGTVTVTETGGTICSTGATLKNTSAWTAGDVTGLKCGVDSSGAVQNAATTSKTCTFTVSADGQITGAWS